MNSQRINSRIHGHTKWPSDKKPSRGHGLLCIVSLTEFKNLLKMERKERKKLKYDQNKTITVLY